MEPPDLQHRTKSGPSPLAPRLLLSGAGWPCPDTEPCSEPGLLPVPWPFPSVPLCLLHNSICREPRDLGLVEGAVCLGQPVFSVCWQLGCACMTRHVILMHTKMLIFFSTVCIHFCYYLHSHYSSFSTAVTYYKVNVFKFTYSLIKSDRNFITFSLFNVKLSSFILEIKVYIESERYLIPYHVI